MNKARFSSSSLMAIIVSTVAGHAAVAQSTGTPGQPPVAGANAAPAEIVVTGSLIARPKMDSNSPIANVEASAFTKSGAITLEDTLNRLPQVVPAYGASSNDDLSGGISTLDLRGLGSNRTLVLMDAHRLEAATALGAVDINNIPQALIQNVEIVTGGASAAYGSDAVAGVVNFKINHRFEGLSIDAQNGISSHGDGFTTQDSITGGAHSADGKGHGEISIAYAKRDAVSNASRPFSQTVRPSSTLITGDYVADAGNLPSQAAFDSVFARYGVAPGSVRASQNLSFNSDGSLFSYQTSDYDFHSPTFGLLDSPAGVQYNSGGVNGLIMPMIRVGAYAHTDYDVSDALNVYAEANFQHVRSTAYYAPGFDEFDVPVTNPFIPANLAAILASRPNPTANFDQRRRFLEVGYRTDRATDDNFQVRIGAKGKLGIGDWTWDLYGSYGHSHESEARLNGFSVSAVQQLIDAPDGGASICAGGLNLFGLQANTECATYIRRNTKIVSTSKQKVVEGMVQGGLLTLPAGQVRVAVGADYRDDGFHYAPDAETQSGDLVSFLTGAIPPVVGDEEVKELYAEISAPLLADLPLIKKLEIDAGYRHSSYRIFGGISTFRAEASWEIIPAFRVRGGYARAVRAPSIADLYAPPSQADPEIGSPMSPGGGDPCDIRSSYRNGAAAASVRSLCLAQGVPMNIIDSYIFDSTQITQGGVAGGNRNLRPEVAGTYTVGGVLTPQLQTPWFSDLSLSADYYSIDLKHAVGTIDGGLAIQKCFNIDGSNASYSASNYYCSLFGRSSATGVINSIAEYNLNLGSIKTSGVDVAIDWRVDLDRMHAPVGGALRIHGAATWLQHYLVQTLPGEAPTDYAGTIGYYDNVTTKALPRWKATINIDYETKAFSLGVGFVA